MSKTFSLTPTQRDQANLALDRATAILELVSDCGSNDSYQDSHPLSTIFVAVDVAKDELGKIQKLLNQENGRLESETALNAL